DTLEARAAFTAALVIAVSMMFSLHLLDAYNRKMLHQIDFAWKPWATFCTLRVIFQSFTTFTSKRAGRQRRCRTSEDAGCADAESVPTANPLSAPSYPYLPKTL
ncbi:hypothetical protein, partial [Senegalimassilia anaerobia]|uniref:hypothetical protein n=1 Tax=Senegalimassilia anaerobia TaxID=1473216 RepID=UPI003AAA8A77